MLILQFYYMFVALLQFDRTFDVISVIDNFIVDTIDDFEVRIVDIAIAFEGYFFNRENFGIYGWVI